MLPDRLLRGHSFPGFNPAPGSSACDVPCLFCPHHPLFGAGMEIVDLFLRLLESVSDLLLRKDHKNAVRRVDVNVGDIIPCQCKPIVKRVAVGRCIDVRLLQKNKLMFL